MAISARGRNRRKQFVGKKMRKVVHKVNSFVLDQGKGLEGKVGDLICLMNLTNRIE